MTEYGDAVRRRAGGRCEYCRLPLYVPRPFHIEHIVARQHGVQAVFIISPWRVEAAT